jgi:sigma-E factor negative regulatory protein RseC
MGNQNIIVHSGIITDIKNSLIKIKIEVNSACGACSAKKACMASEKSEKILEIHENNQDFTVGENVLVSINSSQGKLAAFYAYLLPFLILLFSIIISQSIFKNEAIAGGISIGLIIVYYTILSLLKDKFNNKFRIKVFKTKDK